MPRQMQLAHTTGSSHRLLVYQAERVGGSRMSKWLEESGNVWGRNRQINVRTEEECIMCGRDRWWIQDVWRSFRQDERGDKSSYWTKTMSNMIITAESEGAEVTVTSLKRGFMCSFTLKVKLEMGSCYFRRLERLHFKAWSGLKLWWTGAQSGQRPHRLRCTEKPSLS